MEYRESDEEKKLINEAFFSSKPGDIEYKKLFDKDHIVPTVTLLPEVIITNLEAIKWYNDIVIEEDIYIPDKEVINKLLRLGNIETIKYAVSIGANQPTEKHLIEAAKNGQKEGLEYFSTLKIKHINTWLGLLIGSGGFGKVYRSYDRPDMVVKVPANFEEFYSTLREIATLKHLKGKENIIQLESIDWSIDAMNKEIMPAIIMPSYESDLDNFILNYNYLLDARTCAFIVFQILNGLVGMNDSGLMHRDIKPANILINITTKKVVISDFGSSKFGAYNGSELLTTKISDTNLEWTCRVQTLWYASPEALKRYKRSIPTACNYKFNLDIWSVGLIMMEIYGGKRLEGIDDDIQLNLYLKMIETPINKICPKIKKDSDEAEVITKMLKLNPAERYSARELLKMDLFKDFTIKENIKLDDNNPVSYSEKKLLIKKYATERFDMWYKVDNKHFKENKDIISKAIILFDKYLGLTTEDDPIVKGMVDISLFLADMVYAFSPLSYRLFGESLNVESVNNLIFKFLEVIDWKIWPDYDNKD